MFGLSWMKLGIGFAVIVAIGLFAFAINAGIDKIAKQGAQIEALKIELDAEKAARQRDVQGLTTLAEGIIDASSARSLDETALRETIDAHNPKPVSPELAAFLDRLRQPVGASTDPSTTGRAGAAARAGATPAGRQH
jgi:hypothetical protein